MQAINADDDDVDYNDARLQAVQCQNFCKRSKSCIADLEDLAMLSDDLRYVHQAGDDDDDNDDGDGDDDDDDGGGDDDEIFYLQEPCVMSDWGKHCTAQCFG